MLFKKKRVLSVILGASLLLSQPVTAKATDGTTYASDALPAAGAGYYFALQPVSVSSLREEAAESVNASGALASAGAAATVRAEQASYTPAQSVSAKAETGYPAQEEETAAPVSAGDLLVVRGDTYVNVRSGPGTDYDIVGKMHDRSTAEIIGEVTDWYQIRSGDVTGYIKAEFCMIGALANAQLPECMQTKATVNTTSLNVRTQASTTSDVLAQMPFGEVYDVEEELDEWVRIIYDGQSAYLFKDYVVLTTDYKTAESREAEEARLEKERAAREARLAREAAKAAQNAPAAASAQNYTPAVNYATTYSEQGAAVAAFALQFVGNPYVHGGTSLTNGADCSGFTMSVYAQFGVSLPRIPEAQGRVGTPVDGLANAQPGDIICYGGHVAIYIGNGQIVHASSPRVGIIIGNASYKTPIAIRRIFT